MDTTIRITEEADPEAQAVIGSLIGNHRILKLLGRGGMGAVYLAEHVVMGRRVAIKLLLDEVTFHREAVARFFDEARATARLRHPTLVEVFDCGVTPDGKYYIIMDHLEGETLEARLERERALSIGRAVRIARQIAAGLVVAHTAGIIHRDLKPSNVFLVRASGSREGGGEEGVKILDFGIAKLSAAGYSTAKQTRSGVIVGTPVYMAPEQCRGTGTIDARADVYSLGCLLYAMLCGGPPFRHETMGELIAAHLHEVPPSPRALNAAIPPALEALIARTVAKTPEERPSSAELEVALEALARDLPDDLPQLAPEAAQSRPITVAEARLRTVRTQRRRRLALGAAAAGVLVVGGAFVATKLRRGPGRGADAAGAPASLWAAQVVDSESNGRPPAAPRIGVSDDGQAVVAWRQASGERTSVWVNEYDRRRGWSRARDLAPANAGDAIAMVLSVGPTGAAAVVWREAAGKSIDLWGARRDAAGTWSAPIRLEDEEGKIVGEHVVVDAAGNAMVVWEQSQKKEVRLLARAFGPDGSGGNVVVLDRREPPGTLRGVVIGGSPNGRVVALWIRGAGQEGSMTAARFDPRHGWAAAEALESASEGLGAAEVAVNDAGQAFAAWRNDAAGASLHAARFEPGRGWSPPMLAARSQFPGRDEHGPIGHPEVGMDGRGVAMVVWRELDSVLQNVWGRLHDPARGFGEPLPLEKSDTRNTHRPELAVAGDGSAVAVWQQTDERHADLFSNRYDPATGWSGQVPLEVDPTMSKEVQVARGKGLSVAVWLQGAMGRYRTWAATAE